VDNARRATQIETGCAAARYLGRGAAAAAVFASDKSSALQLISAITWIALPVGLVALPLVFMAL
jgi:hypothetical protein